MTDETQIADNLSEQLLALLKTGHPKEVCTFVRKLPFEEVTHTISHIPEEPRRNLLKMLLLIDPEFTADLLEHFSDDYAADMLEELEPAEAAAIVVEMDSDEQADVLSHLDEDDAEAILRQMAPDKAEDARELLQYDEDTAAGIMITEYLAFRENQDAQSVIEDLRKNRETYDNYEVRYVYSIDENGRLTGIVPMRNLILRPGSPSLEKLMVPDPVTAPMDMPLADLQDLFDHVDLSAVPVIDNTGTLIGVVQRAAVQEAVGEREIENFMKFGGIVGGEELRSMPVLKRALRRMAFLAPNIILSYLAVSIIALFEPLIQQFTALAVFLPMVANLSGAAGNQSVAVSIRELALGFVDEHDVLLVWKREILLGVMNGLVIGSILTGVVFLARSNQPLIAVSIGAAYAMNCILAVTLGGALPLLLRKFNVDPAMLSSPILTTMTDMGSFFLVLSLATIMLVSAGA